MSWVILLIVFVVLTQKPETASNLLSLKYIFARVIFRVQNITPVSSWSKWNDLGARLWGGNSIILKIIERVISFDLLFLISLFSRLRPIFLEDGVEFRNASMQILALAFNKIPELC